VKVQYLSLSVAKDCTSDCYHFDSTTTTAPPIVHLCDGMSSEVLASALIWEL
jgi:hypothetical protein